MKNGLEQVGIVSPFMEDLLALDERHVRTMFLCLLAGDLILLAPRDRRKNLLRDCLWMMEANALTPEFLESTAGHVAGVDQKAGQAARRSSPWASPMTLYNDQLNDNTFKRLEGNGPHPRHLRAVQRMHVELLA